MNKAIDIGDFESMNKISRQLDTFIKTANLAPVQQKDRQQATFAISQMAFLVEKQDFIPEFYIEKPNDRIDEIILDMQGYLMNLVKGEPNLGDLIENAEAIIAEYEVAEEDPDYDQFAIFEKEVMGSMHPEDDEEDEEIVGDV